VLFGSVRVLPAALIVTAGHSLILGLPVALFYRSRVWTKLIAAVAGGFLIGVIPGGLITLPSLFIGSASIDDVPTVVGGMPTFAGWLQYLKLLGELGGLGATGGLTFWLTLQGLGEMKSAGQASALPQPNRTRSGAWAAAAAVIVVVGVSSIPALTEDRSCHNLLRDGRASAAPQIEIDLDIKPEDWPRLSSLFNEFSRTHGMLFRDLSENQPHVLKALSLSICNSAGQVISVEDLRWASNHYVSSMPGYGVPINIFNLNGRAGWRSIARQLVDTLDNQWPGKVRFRDGRGELIQEPAPLTGTDHPLAH
jgi:hypothetical protein